MDNKEYNDKNKEELCSLATAIWRLKRWSDKNQDVMEVKSVAYSLMKYITEQNIEIIDLTGERFNDGLAVSIIDSSDDEQPYIVQMLKPIILQNGSVIQYGQVCLGKKGGA